ncbi:MAG TPA: UDP-glucose/GDP-mannose dehydrogenase family protein [Candidatus Omnitrophota bacterium]|nr:UDP-glucose/GDP-mannose dehydrogenase family protein [Candidatus Omnitrophota bacterium]HPD84148.1 UDP-glucose/GDP-mannose dehydrogenase family protein [Candidatus Omnitrophota bacterium]HRZ03005.1 UDP-glucose/GDP-mannose dehydrogenase family protein [Candidatus Omnitrophota bacterium]
MNIAIVGSGYVGLVTGVCLAQIGHRVICVDNDPEKIKKLKKLQIPIFEPGLKEMLRRNVKQKRLFFTDSIREAAKKSMVIFIAVGTPPKESGEADLIYVENVSREIAAGMDSYKLIVEKSTVPAATGQRITQTIRMNLPKKYKENSKNVMNFDVASNPEFLREGSAIKDFMHPDRIVIGVQSKRAEGLLKEIYKPLKANVVVTDMNSAELIKHASNAFLATKISFANALSQICGRVGADILQVTEGMGLDRRIGKDFLNAGIGYGGSCFPKDVAAFIHLSEKSGYDFSLLKEVHNINEYQKLSFIKLIEDKLWILKNKTIGVWGLSFKPQTDDMRNAPTVDIINALENEGAKIKAYDPQAMSKAKQSLKKVIFCKDAYAAVRGCDCLLLLTEWDEFKNADFKRVKRLMRHAMIFDGRNLLNRETIAKLGFEYFGVGRGKVL